MTLCESRASQCMMLTGSVRVAGSACDANRVCEGGWISVRCSVKVAGSVCDALGG